MTSSKQGPPRRGSAARRPGRWRLQDAKARFSEVVREAREKGPHVSVRGREEVVIVSADEFCRLTGTRTGRALVEACRASPRRQLEMAPARRLPVRDIKV